jgi:hypothetical protein
MPRNSQMTREQRKDQFAERNAQIIQDRRDAGMTMDEIAEKWGMHRKTVERILLDGGVKAGSRRYWTQDEIDFLVANADKPMTVLQARFPHRAEHTIRDKIQKMRSTGKAIARRPDPNTVAGDDLDIVRDNWRLGVEAVHKLIPHKFEHAVRTAVKRFADEDFEQRRQERIAAGEIPPVYTNARGITLAKLSAIDRIEALNARLNGRLTEVGAHA